MHHNTILAQDYAFGHPFALAWLSNYARDNPSDPAADNRGYDNRYNYTAPEGVQKRYRS